MREMLVISIKGERYRVATFPDYQSGYEAWAKGDKALTHQRLLKVEPVATIRPWMTRATVIEDDSTFLALRSTDDPGWNTRPVISLVVARSAKGIESMDRAVAALVKADPDSRLHGHTGGWLYIGTDPRHRTCRLTSHQGWASWWHHNGSSHAGEIAYVKGPIGSGFRFHVVTTL